MTDVVRTAENVLAEIAAERREQINAHGWTAEHDDEHGNGELAMAAACYAAPHRLYQKNDYADGVTYMDPWPWDEKWDRRPHEGNAVRSNFHDGPEKRRALLVKAAALIVPKSSGSTDISLFETKRLKNKTRTEGDEHAHRKTGDICAKSLNSPRLSTTRSWRLLSR